MWVFNSYQPIKPTSTSPSSPFQSVAVDQLGLSPDEQEDFLFAPKVNRQAKRCLKLDIDDNNVETYAFFAIIDQRVKPSEVRSILRSLNEDAVAVTDSLNPNSPLDDVTPEAILKRLIVRWAFKVAPVLIYFICK